MIPISEHADVKRMLLEQKAIAEGALAPVPVFCRWWMTCRPIQIWQQRQTSAGATDLLTPSSRPGPVNMAHARTIWRFRFMADRGMREYIVEQHYRDNRLNPFMRAPMAFRRWICWGAS